jgi:hypothetical protein
MATQGQQVRETFIAGADLSAAQFRFVTAGATGVTLTGAGEAADGVLLNDPANDAAATVVVFGRVIVEAGGTITAGAEVTADADGKVVAATTGDIVLGKALEAGVDGQLISVDFYKGGNASA